MASVRPLQDREAVTQVAAVFRSLQDQFGLVPNIFRVMGHHPGILDGFLKLFQALQTGLLPRFRELAFLHASVLNSCSYCIRHHSLAAEAAGLTPEEVTAVVEGALERFSGQDLEVLSFADQLTLTTQVEESTVRKLRESLSEREFVALAATVALANFTNRFNHACGVELP